LAQDAESLPERATQALTKKETFLAMPLIYAMPGAAAPLLRPEKPKCPFVFTSHDGVTLRMPSEKSQDQRACAWLVDLKKDCVTERLSGPKSAEHYRLDKIGARPVAIQSGRLSERCR
jgi:hypothetical protein